MACDYIIDNPQFSALFYIICSNFRCRECSNTLLPGSYKFTEDDGALVCTHHFTRSTSQNCYPDLSDHLVPTSSSPQDPPNRSIQQSTASQSEDKAGEREDANIHETLRENHPDSSSEEKTEQVNQNPFDESEEEEQDTQQEDDARTKPAANGSNGVLPSTPVRSTAAEGPPVPKPRRVLEPSPAPRPVPRPRPPKSESLTVNGEQ